MATGLPTSPLNIALIGCGKMGSAMLRGWLSANIENRVHVLDPQGLPTEFNDYAPNPLSWYKDADSFTEAKPNADIFVLAVKPQIMKAVCQSIKAVVPDHALILSIAAGQTISGFERLFGGRQPIIRAMPNTPAAIGKGITAAVANPHVTSSQREQAQAVLDATGPVEWIEDEGWLDAITALSGSGPAYIFHMIEALAAAGEAAGLPADLSMRLARQTVIGAAALAETDADTSAATLRENVTSPGGTTAAALEVLMADQCGLKTLMTNTIDAAVKRSRELS